MNYTEEPYGDAVFVFDNGTSVQTQNDDFENFLRSFRLLHIREFYGEHYDLIFNVTFVICIIGLITNVLNVIVFSRTSLLNSMNLFLLLLSVSDIALIITTLAHIVHYYEGYTLFPFYSYYLFLMMGLFFELIFDNISNWFVVTVAIWRFVAVTWPQRCSRWFKKERMIIIVILIVVLSVLLTFPMFLIFTYQSFHYKGYVFYDKDYTEFARTNNYTPLKVYWGFLTLKGLVPMIIMSIATGGLVWHLCTSNQRTDKNTTSYRINMRITLMLIVLLVLFVLSNLPDSFLVLITLVTGGDTELQASYRRATDIVRVFMLTNNCFSFFIYYGLGHEFRREFNKFFCRRLSSKTDEDSVVESSVGNPEGKETNEQAHQMKTVDVK